MHNRTNFIPPTTENILTCALNASTTADRLKLVSDRLLNAPYLSNPLVGDFEKPEEFIYTLSAFDCVTFCETVIALALSSSQSDVITNLQRIRYTNQEIAWEKRNHYMSTWLEENEKNKIIKLDKIFSHTTITRELSTLLKYPALTKTISYKPIDEILTSSNDISDGAIVLFVSLKENLDYFHLGLAFRDEKGELFLRHASKSIGYVNDEKFSSFIARNELLGITQAIVC